MDRFLGRVFAALTAVYLWAYSRRMPRVCCFEPTCSVYASLAWSHHGFFGGMRLVLARLRRCDGGPYAGEDWPPGVVPLGPAPPNVGAHLVTEGELRALQLRGDAPRSMQFHSREDRS